MRNITNLCFPSLLSSFHSTYELLQDLVPTYVQITLQISTEALNNWQTITNMDPLSESDAIHQRLWDKEICNSIHQQILATCTTEIEKARMLANTAKDASKCDERSWSIQMFFRTHRTDIIQKVNKVTINIQSIQTKALNLYNDQYDYRHHTHIPYNCENCPYKCKYYHGQT